MHDVLIIYNPNSTGDGKQQAQALQQELQSLGCKAQVMPTKAAGDGYKKAKAHADEYPNGIVISASGDGGFHEVVNGTLNSQHPTACVGVLPAGNANDHFTSMHRGDLAQRIINSDVDIIDVIEVRTPDWTKYAHSYVGLGMTSQIGKKLTQAKLNAFVESWIVLTHLFKIRPIKIQHDETVERYDNLVFSNIGLMSKYLTLSRTASVTDGKFEITRVKSGSFKALAHHLLRAATNSISRPLQADTFEFTLLRHATIQLDGEVYDLPSGCEITITMRPSYLHEIV